MDDSSDDHAVDEELVKFWNALPQASLDERATGKFLKLADGFVLGKPELGNRFLVRSAYEELIENFNECSEVFRKWVVTGTPGIGKTFFSAYFMWIAACQRKSVVWEPSGAEEIYLMTSDRIQVAEKNALTFNPYLNEKNTVYIVDGHTPRNVTAWTLLVTSPKRDIYHHYTKSAISSRVFMRPWDHDELQRCRLELYERGRYRASQSVMDRLFEWYGGVPRYVLQHASIMLAIPGATENSVVEKLVRDLKEAVSSHKLSDLQNSFKDEISDGPFSHRILHIWPGSLNGKLVWSSSSLAWASVKIQHYVAEQYALQLFEDLRLFIDIASMPEAGSFRGVLYESYAHYILRRGGAFRVRRLLGPDQHSNQQNNNINDSSSINFPVAELKTFRQLDQVDMACTEAYWQPLVRNLRSIDSMRGLVNFFQITTSTHHPIIAAGQEALNRVSVHESRRLYFVVPSAIFATFKYQPYHTLKGTVHKGNLGDVAEVQQWALEVAVGRSI